MVSDRWAIILVCTQAITIGIVGGILGTPIASIALAVFVTIGLIGIW